MNEAQEKLLAYKDNIHYNNLFMPHKNTETDTATQYRIHQSATPLLGESLTSRILIRLKDRIESESSDLNDTVADLDNALSYQPLTGSYQGSFHQWMDNLQDQTSTTEPIFHFSLGQFAHYEDAIHRHTSTFKKTTPVTTVNVDHNVPREHHDNEINTISEMIFSQLRDERYISGELSIVDYRIEGYLRDKGEAFVLKLMSKLALMCYSSKIDVTYAHFLNVLKNFTFHSKDDSLKTNVLAALGHRSIVIKEAAIAVFEGWHYQSKDDVSQVIGLLKNVDTGHIGWLTEYKNMVISDLKDEFEV